METETSRTIRMLSMDIPPRPSRWIDGHGGPAPSAANLLSAFSACEELPERKRKTYPVRDGTFLAGVLLLNCGLSPTTSLLSSSHLYCPRNFVSVN
jgi:hypothetical protein